MKPLLLLIITPIVFAQEIKNIDELITPEKIYPGCTIDSNWQMDKLGRDRVVAPQIKANTSLIQANELIGQKSGKNYVQGNVIGYKANKTIIASWLSYEKNLSHATGEEVTLSRDNDIITGSWIDYYLDKDQGIVKNATTRDYRTDMYARGEELKILSKDKYKIDNGYFTTCPIDNPDWHITSQKMQVDYQDNQGSARHAVFYAKSLPIFYTPYLQFPLGRRRSGILAPEFGLVNNNTYVGIPYYWNIAPNYDMTIIPKIFSLDGIIISDQFRYLDKYGTGEIYTEQMPSNQLTKKYRYYWHLQDRHNFLPELETGYNYNNVSDDNYFNDLGNFYSTINNINLEQSIYTRYRPKWGNFGIKVQTYQTLQPTNQPIASSPIYTLGPQIDFNVNSTNIIDSPLKLDLISQYTNFIGNNSLQSGQRLVIYPSITLPIEKIWGYIKPKIGYNYTNYMLSSFSTFQNQDGTVNRYIPIASVDSSLVFDKRLSSNYLQTLEPRLYYLYIPTTNQANIPVFDTAQATPNLNQLFSENRFSGFDRINSANDVTIGLSGKLINTNNGVQIANWGIGYREYLNSQNNLIYGSYDQFRQLYQPQPNLITELSNRWTDSLTTDASFQYSTVFQLIDAYSLQTKFNPDIHKIINFKFNYQYSLPLFYYAWIPGQVYNPVSTINQYAFDLSGQWPLFSERWLIEGRANYDITQQKFINFLTGIEYNAGCWGVSFVYQNYIANSVNYKQAYYIQFSLKGLTSFGTGDPTNNLQLNIPGYTPITTIR